jgi:phosphatidate phosphatase APP1
MVEDHQRYKLARIRAILQTFPSLDFVLLGDSGQQDPELYAQAVADYGARIRAVFIRDVTEQVRDDKVLALAEESVAAGVPMVLAPDSPTMARHALSLGLLTPEDAVAVQAAVNGFSLT